MEGRRDHGQLNPDINNQFLLPEIEHDHTRNATWEMESDTNDHMDTSAVDIDNGQAVPERGEENTSQKTIRLHEIEFNIRRDLMTVLVSRTEDLKRMFTERTNELVEEFKVELDKITSSSVENETETVKQNLNALVTPAEESHNEEKQVNKNDRERPFYVVNSGGEQSASEVNTITKTAEKDVPEKEPVLKERKRDWQDIERKDLNKTPAMDRLIRIKDRRHITSINCVLNPESDYSLWRDKVTAQIQAYDGLFTIDKNVPPPEDMSEKEQSLLRIEVRIFIINHLNEYYHRLVMNTKEPSEMMRMLDQAGQPVSRYSGFALRRQFSDMRYTPECESALEFITRFSDMVEKIRRTGDLSDIEIKQNFLIAVERACPRIGDAEWNHQVGYALDDLKRMLFENEQKAVEVKRRSKENRDSGNAMYGSNRRPVSSTPTKRRTLQPPNTETCFNCGDNGHYAKFCPNQGKKKCYFCKKITNHLAADCPENVGRERSEKEKGFDAEKAKGIYQKRKTEKDRKKDIKFKKVNKKMGYKIKKRRQRMGQANILMFDDQSTIDLSEDEQMVYIQINSDSDSDETMAHYADAEAQEMERRRPRRMMDSAYATYENRLK
uniref:Protein lin-28 B n=1 Tax=Lygus hesperus TaxID=30085 RepID=A0A0A9Y042_LYGHE